MGRDGGTAGVDAAPVERTTETWRGRAEGIRGTMTFYVPSDIEEIIDRLGGDGKMFYGASVVVSGGAGFLGRYLVEALKRLGASKFTVIDILVMAGKMG